MTTSPLYILTFVFTVIFSLLPSMAHAHSVMGGNVFYSGLLHPVLGTDHLLAMVAVGIISAQMGGRAIWSVPATFVLVMAAGGAFGIYALTSIDFEFGISIIEHGIVASVIVLGLAIALDKHIREIIAMAIVAFFAFFHGFAHGYEFPVGAIPWTYIAGFMCGTAALHVAGVLIGLVGKEGAKGRTVIRHIGSGLMGMGAFMAIESIQFYLQ
ncbi:MAG: urease accessory protein UreJ [Micavibrio sp.]|nr:urease accessory protein UreJ [Micavibrio sp.]|tara:strand:- start:5471 stop:6106 length:636 start_codon:yes stop_codon:yes gene_type:complete